MAVSSIESVPKKKTGKEQKIPKHLIYEVVDGQPIYYRGYQDVLNETKTFEEIMGDSTLQAWLKAHISILIGALLMEKGYEITAGEQGLNLPNKVKRGADIAIFKEENFVLNEHYANLPPEIIIEIDIKADTSKQSDLDYIHKKIEDYLKFGAKKVIWIFTHTEKVMIATSQKPWMTDDWNIDIEVIEGVDFNLEQLVEKRRK